MLPRNSRRQGFGCLPAHCPARLTAAETQCGIQMSEFGNEIDCHRVKEETGHWCLPVIDDVSADTGEHRQVLYWRIAGRVAIADPDGLAKLPHCAYARRTMQTDPSE